MACNFTIQFSDEPHTMLNKAKHAVEKQGGTFEGDSSQGNFGVSVFGSTIKGSYTVAGQHLNINITSKPFLIPCSTIEGFLKNQIGN